MGEPALEHQHCPMVTGLTAYPEKAMLKPAHFRYSSNSRQIEAGDVVDKDTSVFVIEAMKMEATITAPFESTIKAIHLKAGELVAQGDLVIELE